MYALSASKQLQSVFQAASLKDKWGLGYKPSYNRSKSISAAGRPAMKRIERQRYTYFTEFNVILA